MAQTDIRPKIIRLNIQQLPFICLACWTGFVSDFPQVASPRDCLPVPFHKVTDFGWERRVLTYPAEITTFTIPQPAKPLMQEKNLNGVQEANSELASGQNSRTKHFCDHCSKSYTTVTTLLRHQQFHCNSYQKKPFHCKYCDKLYVSLGALKMHIRTHTLPCKCKICGKAFSRPWLLQGHIRTHTGEKPYKCPSCQRAFADRSNLRAHLQTHSEVKKYCCTRCSKSFSRMSLLLKHEESGCLTGEI